MHYEVEVSRRMRRVVVHRVGGAFAVAVDGRPWRVDAARIDAHTLSLIVGTVSSGDDTGDAADPLMRSGGPSYDVTVTPEPGGQLVVRVGATPLTVTLNGGRRRHDDGAHAGDGPQRIASPMPGKVVRVLVAAGDAVRARQPVVVVEAMKMENEVRAGRDGTVAEIHVKEGVSVEAGAALMDIR